MRPRVVCHAWLPTGAAKYRAVLSPLPHLHGERLMLQAVLLPEPLTAQLLRQREQQQGGAGAPGGGQAAAATQANGHAPAQGWARQRGGGGGRGGGWRAREEERRRQQQEWEEQQRRQEQEAAAAEEEVGVLALVTRSQLPRLLRCHACMQPGLCPTCMASPPRPRRTCLLPPPASLAPADPISPVPTLPPLQAAAGLWTFVNEERAWEGPYTVAELRQLVNQ